MSTSSTTTSLPIQEFTRRGVRAWWADGLWDFSVAGFFAITAYWAYILVRVIAFPTWTWPWPFITDEVINPLQMQIQLWMLAIIPVVAIYMWLTYVLVTYLKAHWLASRQGDVRHSFWMKIEARVWITYLVGYLGMFVLIAALEIWRTGGMRVGSALCISASFSIMIAIGAGYKLPRYVTLSVIGLIASLAVELFFTTNASFKAGPQNFLDVSADSGNPAIPLLIWAVIFLISGIIGLNSVLKQAPNEQ